MKLAKRLLRSIARRFGFDLVPAGRGDLVYLHTYTGGYAEYRAVQIAANKAKLERVWADETTLGAIAADISARHPAGTTRGICHGARNGFEVDWLQRRLGGEVIGTDISDTATRFPNMVVWDFHEPNPAWEGRFDFVYTNALDQAAEPERALAVWTAQLAPGGCIYIEHTHSHGVEGAGEMDPFGAHPMVMPYLFFVWGKGRFGLHNILEIESKANQRKRAWVFVLRKVEPASD